MKSEKQICPQCGNRRVLQDYGLCCTCKLRFKKDIAYLLKIGWVMVRVKPEAIEELKHFSGKTNCTPNTFAQEIIECYLAEKRMKQKALARQLETIITRSPKQDGPESHETPEADPDYPLD